MSGTIFALIVAIYGPSTTFDHKPHLYSFFFTREACVEAAQHFEQQVRGKHDAPVAICVEREAANPLPTS